MAQWQINWDNPWEVYNFTYSEYGPVLLDPDGAIRHTETREEAEARKNKLTVGDEFKFLLAFALGLRRVRIFEKSTGYDPEATVKIQRRPTQTSTGKVDILRPNYVLKHRGPRRIPSHREASGYLGNQIREL